MPQRGYRGVAGQPVQPYVLYTTNVGSDVWLNLTFVDRFGNPAIPVALTYRIDNLTTDTVVLYTTAIPGPYASQMTINIPAVINQIDNVIGQSSQTNQVSIVATFSDGSQKQDVFIYELIAVQVVGGNSQASTGIVFTVPPTGTGGTMTTLWPYPSGNYQITFSDGESQTGLFVQNYAGVTWLSSLTGTPSVSAIVVLANNGI